MVNKHIRLYTENNKIANSWVLCSGGYFEIVVVGRPVSGCNQHLFSVQLISKLSLWF